MDEQFPGFLNWYTLLINYFQTTFDTKGDITFLTAGKGLEIISPNGKKYKATMTNAGTWDITPG